MYRTEQRRPTSSGRTAGVYIAVEGFSLARRTGRPLKAPANARSVKLTVYLTQEQDYKLARYARKHGTTKAQGARVLMGYGWDLQQLGAKPNTSTIQDTWEAKE